MGTVCKNGIADRRISVGNKAFVPQRVTRTYRQTIHAAPEIIFPLLCPERETDWLDGWQYEMIYSESGLVEAGAVFSTPQDGEADTVWVVSKHDVNTYQVEFVRFTHDSRTCVLKIAIQAINANRSYVDIAYTYTSLTPLGNMFMEQFTQAEFLQAVTFWEASMNHYLKTGQKLQKI
jgi:hypothetical protein